MTDFANATPANVDVVKRERCYEGFYKLDRLHLRHELFGGVASGFQRRPVVGLEQTLAGTQGQGDGGHGGNFEKRHGRPF